MKLLEDMINKEFDTQCTFVPTDMEHSSLSRLTSNMIFLSLKEVKKMCQLRFFKHRLSQNAPPRSEVIKVVL